MVLEGTRQAILECCANKNQPHFVKEYRDPAPASPEKLSILTWQSLAKLQGGTCAIGFEWNARLSSTGVLGQSGEASFGQNVKGLLLLRDGVPMITDRLLEVITKPLLYLFEAANEKTLISSEVLSSLPVITTDFTMRIPADE